MEDYQENRRDRGAWTLDSYTPYGVPSLAYAAGSRLSGTELVMLGSLNHSCLANYCTMIGCPLCPGIVL